MQDRNLPFRVGVYAFFLGAGIGFRDIFGAPFSFGWGGGGRCWNWKEGLGAGRRRRRVRRSIGVFLALIIVGYGIDFIRKGSE